MPGNHSPSLHIRAATEADISILAPLFEAFFEEEGIDTSRQDITDNLALMIGFPTSILLIAEHADGTPVGFASASLTAGVEYGVSAEIEDLYLIPEMRGQGWSKPLMDAIFSACRDKGAVRAAVVVTPDGQQQGLPGYYNALGFHALDRALYAKNIS